MKNPFRSIRSSTGRRSDSDRRSFVPFATMLAGIVLVTTLGPTVVDGLSNQLEQPEVESLAAPDSVATVTSDTDGPESTTDVTVTTESAPGAPTTAAPDPTTTAAPDATTTTTTTAPDPTTAPTTTEANTPLRTIQLVPALRDVIVEIDGHELLSDADGVIRVGDVAPDAVFDFIGVRAQPSLREVSFGNWSDGDRTATRDLAEIDGPTTQIGLVLSNRVTVSTEDSAPDGAEIGFTSDAGPMRLEVGRATWVPAMRAIDSREGLVAQEIDYVTDQLIVGANAWAIEPQTFVPTPEALWVARIDSPST